MEIVILVPLALCMMLAFGAWRAVLRILLGFALFGLLLGLLLGGVS